jgi:GAF domain-containing protein
MWTPGAQRQAPAPTAGWGEPPPNLAERLLELTAEVRAEPDARAAAARALQVAVALVDCEAGSVLRTTSDDDALEFFVVQGGAGEELAGRKVPFHEGIAGACYDSGVSVRVDDVALDPRHLREIDRDTGFVTRSVLCVPVRSEHGFHGVIELLNPRSRSGGEFLSWHVDVVESLAAALAETVAGR